jgi:hypothetical protein
MTWDTAQYPDVDTAFQAALRHELGDWYDALI